MKKREYHGMTHDRVYWLWKQMIQRCTNPKVHQYQDYGGRGITVCRRWRESFVAFLADMGPRPPGQTLDRQNNNGNYTPKNCKWSTRVEQRANSRPAKERTANRGISHRNMTGVSGVCWYPQTKRFRVSMKHNNERIYLGYTEDFFEACCRRKSKENEVYGR